MAERTLDIGVLARRTGVAPSALRYYERLGLLSPVGRNGLRRAYGPEALDRVALILSARAAGFSLTEVAGLLAAEAGEVRGLLEEKCLGIDAHMAALTRARERIGHALECRHASLLDCPTFRAGLREALPGDRPGP
ncbi:MerR family transcriptional regulator [Streptomyces sp. NPDC052040]|uniref:MerR family transcriptional regulator n=1 Tax=Streptomyces sp. NPDC052040 TaxID=3365682 RepID=UPI0037D2ED94